MSARVMLRYCFLCASLLHPCGAFAQSGPLQPAVRSDPIDAIIQAFDTHAIVALGEGAHRSLSSHEFRLRLVRDPRFPRVVNDIVVEFGNARYQNTIDRFLDGKQVSPPELRKVWEDTTQVSGVWDVPIYEQFLREIRNLNASRPKEEKLRVLLGDPPIDWGIVKTRADVQFFLSQRDEFPASVIRREVLAKHRSALVVYGDMHLLRRNLHFSLPDQREAEAISNSPVNSIVSRLEKDGETKVFSIVTPLFVADWAAIQSDIPHWPLPSLVRVRQTAFGARPFAILGPQVRMFRNVDGIRKEFAPDPSRSGRIQDQFDAVLILTLQSTPELSQRPVERCRDARYMEMRLARLEIAASAGVTDPSSWFRRECLSQMN